VIRPTKVKAHQDKIKSRDELSLLEELNIQCDEIAKSLIIKE